MSRSTQKLPSSRITANSAPRQEYTAHTYRKAYPHLMQDFNRRCAYSLIHESRSGRHHIDHFAPKSPRSKSGSRRVHRYTNLRPAHPFCNQAKSDHWPTRAMRAAGIRFLDARKEHDYGVQIFEDPQSHELVGTTPAARYHITKLDLNHPYFVGLRRDRSKLRGKVQDTLIETRSDEALKNLRDVLAYDIPPIDPPPSKNL